MKTSKLQIEQIISKIFKENNLYYDYWILNEKEVSISVQMGDWKHDHLFLKNLMSKNNFILFDSTTYPSDCDSYSAEYTFLLL